MTEDARFEDGVDKPVRLMAADAEDLKILSALAQDAVFNAADLKWEADKRRFVMLLNRFRWEDRATTGQPERVRALLFVDDVLSVRSQGVEKGDADTVLSLLAMDWTDRSDGAGELLLTLAGDGGIAITAECLNLTLLDVTRPYRAISGKAPSHPET